MIDREKLLTAITDILDTAMDGIENGTAAQEKREKEALRCLLSVCDLAPPTQEDYKQCYPW
jgi:hypothetical protein